MCIASSSMCVRLVYRNAVVASTTTGSVTPPSAATMTPRRRRLHRLGHRDRHSHHPRQIAHYYLFLYARTAETGFGTHCVWVTRGQHKNGARGGGGGCISDVFNARRRRVFAGAILHREGTARRTFLKSICYRDGGRKPSFEPPRGRSIYYFYLLIRWGGGAANRNTTVGVYDSR